MNRNQNRREVSPRKFLPQLEVLEDRCCPSVTVQQHGDDLRIKGDDGPDVVAVVATFGIVTVNANNQINTYFGIENIDIDLKGGNDAVIFETEGAMPPTLDPNPFVQNAQMQNRMFVNFILANPFLLQNKGIADLVRFGEELNVEVDGGRGLDAFFANVDTVFPTTPFTTRVDLDLDDVEFLAPTSFINAPMVTNFFNFQPPNFLAPGTTM